MAETGKKYAVVTGGNKGIGFEICRQLLSHGITVVLTARDKKRGVEAVEKLKASSAAVSDSTAALLFHPLDVTSLSSTASLADFIRSRFGKLDILVNNAGIGGAVVDADAVKTIAGSTSWSESANVNWNEILSVTYDLAGECIETNYYGVKKTTEALLPLLNQSNSPRIVNVSSTMGKLKNIQNEWAKGILNDAENLTEERIDEVLTVFLKDFKESSLAAKGWPQFYSAYTVSKAALNAYTRVLAKKHTVFFRINCVCPGFVKTDLNHNTGFLTVEEGAKGPVRLALLPDDGPSGLFFVKNEMVSSYVE